MKGKVIKSTGSWYIVLDGTGREWECRLRGKIRLVTMWYSSKSLEKRQV